MYIIISISTGDTAVKLKFADVISCCSKTRINRLMNVSMSIARVTQQVCRWYRNHKQQLHDKCSQYQLKSMRFFHSHYTIIIHFLLKACNMMSMNSTTDAINIFTFWKILTDDSLDLFGILTIGKSMPTHSFLRGLIVWMWLIYHKFDFCLTTFYWQACSLQIRQEKDNDDADRIVASFFCILYKQLALPQVHITRNSLLNEYF